MKGIFTAARGGAYKLGAVAAVAHLIVPVHVLMLICLVAFPAAAFATGSVPWLPFVPFLGFAGCVLYLQYGVRCPRCRGSIALLTMLPGGGYFRLSNQVRFCPYCGLSLEEERDG